MNDRIINDDELALVYAPGDGLRLELPLDHLPIGIDGAVLAGIFMRLKQDADWAGELKRWVMSEFPAMTLN